MNDWDWRGAVALVIALAVGIGWAVALILAVIHEDDLTQSGAALLYVLGGTLSGGVIGWLGGNGTGRHREGPK